MHAMAYGLCNTKGVCMIAGESAAVRVNTKRLVQNALLYAMAKTEGFTAETRELNSKIVQLSDQLNAITIARGGLKAPEHRAAIDKISSELRESKKQAEEKLIAFRQAALPDLVKLAKEALDDAAYHTWLLKPNPGSSYAQQPLVVSAASGR